MASFYVSLILLKEILPVSSSMNRIGEVTALVPMDDIHNQSLMMEQTGATSSFTEEDVKHYLHEVLIKIRNKEKVGFTSLRLCPSYKDEVYSNSQMFPRYRIGVETFFLQQGSLNQILFLFLNFQIPDFPR